MSTKDPKLRRTLRGGTVTVIAAASLAAAPNAMADDVAAGRNLEVNPDIEYVLFEGLGTALNGRDVQIVVTRGGTTIATKTRTVSGGLVEVNHVGGADCWDGNGTPDIRGGDRITATVLDALGAPTADVDFIDAANIRFTETVAPDGSESVLQGTAHSDAARTEPLTGGEVFEAVRVTTPRESAPITNVNATTGAWSVTLPGNGGEVKVDHINPATGGGNATTTANPVGEVAELPCGPLLGTALTSLSKPVLNIANAGQELVVGGSQTGPEKAISVSLGGETYPAQDAGETWSATVPAADLAALPQGPHDIVATFTLGASDSRTIVKDTVAPTLSSSLAPGQYEGNQSTTLISDAANVRFTRDGSAPTPTSGTAYDTTPIALAAGTTHVLRARAEDQAGNATTIGPLTYDVRQASTPPVGNGPGQSSGAPGGSSGTVPPGSSSNVFSFLGSAPALGRVTIKERIKVKSARKRGLAVVAGVPEGATVLRLVLTRRVKGVDKTVFTVTNAVTKSGLVVGRLDSAKVRAKLRRGTYRIRVATGRDATTFGPEKVVTTTLVG